MNSVLYSPWRLNYIIGEKEKQCIFCTKPTEEDDVCNLILYRSKLSFVIMNLYPYNNGHLMVIPNRHVAELSDLSTEEITDLFETVKLSEKILKTRYKPQGINIGLNIGKAAGAGIDEHIHVHLVPRWMGDCNFMTTVGGTRVVPEDFEQAYLKLKEHFDNEHIQK